MELYDDPYFHEDLLYSLTALGIVGVILWGMEFILYSSTVLTLIVAYLAYRSNRTTEKLAKLQVIAEAISIAKTLRIEPLLWSGHAKGISQSSYETIAGACQDCERVKAYFSTETEAIFDSARSSALEFISHTVMPTDGVYVGDQEEDRRLSRLRQTASDKAAFLLKELQRANRDNKIRI